MNREIKLAIREIRRAEREQRILAVLAGIEAHRVAHEQKLDVIHARVEARKAERHQRKTEEIPVKAAPNPELQAMKAAMMANVPTIHFPEDDPKYHSARKYGREKTWEFETAE
ncbi:MAG: hypothetical protein ABTA22_00140 [Clostridia bacterium]